MSEYESWTGTLKPTGKTIEETMKDVEFPGYYDKSNYEHVCEFFNDKYYKEKVLIDGLVYDVEKTDFEVGDIFDASRQENGDISFTIQYYNGGCGFDEALDRALKDA